MANKVTEIRYAIDRTGESHNQVVIYRENSSFAFGIRTKSSQARIEKILSTMVLDTEKSGPSGDFDVFYFIPAIITVNNNSWGLSHSYKLQYNDRDSVTLKITGSINRMYNAIRHYQTYYMLTGIVSPYGIFHTNGYEHSRDYDLYNHSFENMIKVAKEYTAR